MKQLPNLLKQETSSLHASLGVLYRMYDDTQRQSDWEDVEHRLFRFANQIMSSFLALQVCMACSRHLLLVLCMSRDVCAEYGQGVNGNAIDAWPAV
jgi:hypothetical protein